MPYPEPASRAQGMWALIPLEDGGRKKEGRISWGRLTGQPCAPHSAVRMWSRGWGKPGARGMNGLSLQESPLHWGMLSYLGHMGVHRAPTGPLAFSWAAGHAAGAAGSGCSG